MIKKINSSGQIPTFNTIVNFPNSKGQNYYLIVRYLFSQVLNLPSWKESSANSLHP